MSEFVKLSGFNIIPESLSKRFSVEFEEGEWYHFKKEIERSWGEMDYGLEKVIVDHIKNSLMNLDYKPTLKDDRLTFVKK